MRNWIQNIRRALGAPAAVRQCSSRRLGLEALEDRNLPSGNYLQTNLVSDTASLAAHTDTNLVNPWGLAYGPAGPWWVANNTSGTSTLYDNNGIAQPVPPKQPLVVTVPPAT